jgi:predicted RNA-binding Zn ribbon-like protein
MSWFTHLTASLVANFAQAATLFADDALAAASSFADAAGKVGSATGSALKGLQDLASADWAKSSPTGSSMAWFTHLIASLIENFRVAAQQFSDEGMKQAQSFADTATKVLGVIGGGVDGLLKLNTFVAPSKQAIDNFLAAALYVVDRFGQVAANLATEGIAKTTAFADAAGKALAATKTGVDAFLAFKDLVIPSKEAIDNLLNGMVYVIDQMRAMANRVGTEGLKQASDFADGAGKVFATVKGALELMNSLKTFKDYPADALRALFDGMEEAIDQMKGRVSQSAALSQNADTFLGNMQEAARKMNEGLRLMGVVGTGAPGAVAPAISTGGGSGSGGGRNGERGSGTTVNINAPVFGVDHLEDVVVGAVTTATSRGRL